MRNVTIKGLLAHKLRLALTALAIVLGVTFISGTFILTDTLHNTFSVLFGSVYQRIDFQVRGVAQLGSGANATGSRYRPAARGPSASATTQTSRSPPCISSPAARR
jgi:putative ABC transport system permease protein